MIEISDGILTHNSIPRMTGIDSAPTFRNPLKEKYSLRLYNDRKKLKLQIWNNSLLSCDLRAKMLINRSVVLIK
jgi:hypothetical protein